MLREIFSRSSAPREDAPSFATDRRIFVRILREARPFWLAIFLIFLLDLVSIPLALLEPVGLKIAVDSVLGDKPLPGFIQAVVPSSMTTGDMALLWVAIGVIVLHRLVDSLYGLGMSFGRSYTSERMVLRFRAKMFQHVQRLSLSHHDSKGTADAIYRIQYDAEAIQWVALDGVLPYVTQAFKLVTVFIVVLKIDVTLSLVALVVAPFLYVSARFYRPSLRRRWRDVKGLETSALSVVHEVVSAIRVVKAFGAEDREQERFETETKRGIRARIQVLLVSGSFGAISGLVATGGRAAVLFLGVRHVLDGSLSLGDLLLVMSYLSQIYAPMRQLGHAAPKLSKALTSAERSLKLLDEPVDVEERPDARSLDRATGHVVFDDVRFHYGDEREVLSGVSFHVPAGTRVGISGRTGAGKTTLVNLIARFYDPTDGKVLLDGVDIRDYRVADLRDQFALVPQDPVLFSTTIAENIAYSRPDATRDEIVAAAKAANAHDFILGLPKGYDNEVGERGMLLSGGERQRIALARAFLKDAPLLIFDEPTSSIDRNTEQLILEAMNRLMEGRTTFMIAHRLDTLDMCDLRLELQDGKVHVNSPGLAGSEVWNPAL